MIQSKILHDGKAVLNCRLDGLSLSALLHRNTGIHVPSEFDTGSDEFAAVVGSFYQSVFDSSVDYSGLGALQGLVVEYGETTLLVSELSNGLAIAIASDDKIGDVLFHGLWSVRADLGVRTQINLATNSFLDSVNSYLAGLPPAEGVLGQNPRVDFTSIAAADVVASKESEVRRKFTGLVLMGKFQQRENGNFKFSTIHSSSGVKAYAEWLANLVVRSHELCEQDAASNKPCWRLLVIHEFGQTLLTKGSSEEAWDVLGVAAKVDSIGKIFHWADNNLTSQLLSDSEAGNRRRIDWKNNREVNSILANAKSRLRGVLILALGNWKQKLPWGPPILYDPQQELGEYMGLADISTSLIELAEQLDLVLCDKDKTESGIATVVLEFDDGCCVLSVVNEDIISVVAARERTWTVKESIAQATQELRELFGFRERKIRAELFPGEQKGGRSDEFTKMTNENPGLLFAAVRESSDLVSDYSSEHEYDAYYCAKYLEPHLGDMYGKLDGLVEKCEIFSKFALGGVLGEVRAITSCDQLGKSLTFRSSKSNDTKGKMFVAVAHSGGDAAAISFVDEVTKEAINSNPKSNPNALIAEPISELLFPKKQARTEAFVAARDSIQFT